MKRTGFLVAVLLGLAVGAGAAEAIKASSLVKVFTGANGEKVTIVYLEPMKRNRALIKFEGVTGDWEGKVILHVREMGSWSDDYKTYVKQTEFRSIVGRSRQGVMKYELYPLGVPTSGIALTYDAEESKKALGSKIVYEFNAANP